MRSGCAQQRLVFGHGLGAKPIGSGRRQSKRVHGHKGIFGSGTTVQLTAWACSVLETEGLLQGQCSLAWLSTPCRLQAATPLPSVSLHYPQQLVVSRRGNQLSLMMETDTQQNTPKFMCQQPKFIFGHPLLQGLQISCAYTPDCLGS